MTLIPRDYQIAACDAAVENLLGKGKGVVVLPVGSGKSLVFSLVAKKLQSKVLVVAHSAKLVEQNYEAALEMGVENCAVYCASLGKKDIGEVTFCSIKSAKAAVEEFKQFNYVILDECHYSFPPNKDSEYHKFFKSIGLKSYVGFTATPLTTKRYTEGSMIKVITRIRPANFSKIIYHLPTQEMVKNNYWTPLKFILYDFDETLLEYNTTGSDFTDVSVQKAISHLNVNNNAYLATKKLLNEGKKDILLYCNSLDDAKIFHKNLQDSAIISYSTKQKDRDRVHEEFKSGKIRCLISLDSLKAGYNNKLIKYIVIARCYGSIVDFLQVCGRAQRTHALKELAYILDVGGNYSRFGSPVEVDIREDVTGKWALYSDDNLLSDIYHNEIGNYKVINNKLIQVRSKWEVKPDNSYANYKMEFGKFKNRPLKSIPAYYLKFLVEKTDYPIEVEKYLGKLKKN